MAEFKPYIYFAYSHKDSEFVMKLHEALSSRGVNTWIDTHDIQGGQEWRKEIDSAIVEASILLFVLSPDFLSSSWLERYLMLTKEYSKSIIPIIHSEVMPENLPEPLANLQWIDFREPKKFDEALEELLRAIKFHSTQFSEQIEMNQQTVVTNKETETVIKFLSEGNDTPEECLSTYALARLLIFASLIARQNQNDFDVCFDSILIAFLCSDDTLAKWFKVYIREVNIDMELLLSKQNLNQETLSSIANLPVTKEDFEETWRRTSSTTLLFQNAQEFRNVVSVNDAKMPLDVRHLMAAYIYSPSGHENDLESLRLNRVAWSNAFLGQIAQHYSIELEKWKEIHIKTFPDNPPEVLMSRGPSTHIATDIWTLNDTLGYRAYAYAIYRFIKHPQTKPPLTISIQAPWGGGKTSLMRMIQKMLDPDACEEIKKDVEKPRGSFTIAQVLEEIDEWIRTDTKNKLPEIPKDKKRKLLTVWFNAWKYESTNQVWAGLADAIMQQIAARLPLDKRELFWLRLNLKRVDTEKIRTRIHERIINYLWRGIHAWIYSCGAVLFISTIIMLIGWFVKENLAQIVGWGGIGSSLSVSVISIITKYHNSKRKVKEEPATVSLSDYLDIPDYENELGFIHNVEADLQRVFASVPKQYRPIVIFIDDLDRCSPIKVAQVVEAVNLFLAGDFPNCIFLLGMDSEMVAAALQSAHKEMIACLPADAGIPVGWRFMDKFVQLPFLIPPAEDTEIGRYTKSLFEVDGDPVDDTKVEQIARQVAEQIQTRSAITGETARLQQKHELNEAQRDHLHDKLEAQLVQHKLDEGIKTFTDKNPEIQRVIAAATSHFRGNPREMKRFINSFRFNYFIWWARCAQELESPTLDQLLRWTVLSMKWPEVVRWLRRSSGNDWQVKKEENSDQIVATVTSRLKLLEDISSKAVNLTTWHEQAKAELRLTPKEAPWLNDDDLLQFFYEESKQNIAGQRLSDGQGKGLW